MKVEAVSSVIEWLDAAAAAWIGLALPSPETAIREAGWVGDDPAGYCGRCGESVGPGEADRRGCGRCRSLRLAYGATVRLGRFDGALRQWVHQIKYHQWAEMATALGHRLGEAVLARGLVSSERVIVVPMPMPWARRLYRRIDHAAAIASGLADAVAIPGPGRLRHEAPVCRILGKKNGAPQVSLAVTERKSNLRGRIYVRKTWGKPSRRRKAQRAPGSLDGAHLILVDDVRTTGASLHAAASVLRRLGPERVVAAVVGVADDPGRRAASLSSDRSAVSGGRQGE